MGDGERVAEWARGRRSVRWLSAVACAAGLLAAVPAAQAASWHIVASPNPNQGSDGLVDVSASSGTNVWAVGLGSDILRWNGTHWNTMPPPDFEARHVVALSPTSAIVQGDDLVAVWNGTSWQTLPAPPGFALFGVSARSASDIWVVGTAPPPAMDGCAVTHWNGASWEDMASASVCTPGTNFADILEVSPTSVWVAGWEGKQQNRILSAHWNGATWTPTFAPIHGMSALEGMGGTAGQIWVTGLKSKRDANSQWGWAAKLNTSQRWDPIGFTPEWDAAGLSHVFYDISARASDSAWAVGHRVNPDHIWKTWTSHWDGISWVDLGGPNAGTAGAWNHLNAVTVVPGSTANVWAVGYSQEEGHDSATLILHWS